MEDKLKILIACEESQAVCIEMRKRGHEAYSCDILECSGGHPEWHIQDDVLKHLDDGWDMMIAFPPCTHLAVSGCRWFDIKIADGRQQKGINFFMEMVNAPIDKIAVENPISIMSTEYRKPDQIIHPYYFGNPERKSTCLWLKNLLPLKHIKDDDLFNKKTWVDPEFIVGKNGKKYTKTHYGLCFKGNKEEQAKLRSKTYPGIAKAMATQWTKCV